MIGYDHNAEIKRYEDEILRKRIAVNKLEDKVDAIKRDLDRSWFKGSKKESLRRWQDVLKNEQESLNAEIVTYSDLVKNKPSLQEELQSSQLFKKRFSDVLQELDKLEGKDKPEIIKVVPYPTKK
jgi:predicted  nucleic acid-binding Zn-ribbon protein